MSSILCANGNNFVRPLPEDDTIMSKHSLYQSRNCMLYFFVLETEYM